MEAKVLLHDDNAEKNVVGCIITSEEYYYSVADRIRPYLFTLPKAARVISIVMELARDGININLATVTEYTFSHPDANNPEVWELAEFGTNAVTGAFGDSFNIVESYYTRRQYFALGTKLLDFGTNPTISLEETNKQIAEVLNSAPEKKAGVTSLKQANKAMRDRVQKNYDGSSDTMIPTGFTELDERGGFQIGDFNVIAAEPSMGKTSLLTCIMVNAASSGIPCMLFSMEMSSPQIAARINSPKAKISSSIIQYKKLSDWQMNELSQAVKKTDNLPIYFDDEATISFDSIVASMRRNVKRLNIKLIGIDYLQILAATGNVKNQETFLGTIARRLKNLAKELQVCIVALSQLSRNSQEPKPTLGRVRASGQIVEAADDVLMIWRPTEYGKGYDEYPAVPTQNTAELIMGKGRNIGTFSFIVAFDKPTTQFSNYDGEVKKVGEVKIVGKVETQAEKKDDPMPFQQPSQGELPF